MIRVLFPFVGGDLVGGSYVSALNLISGFDRSRIDPVIVVHREAGALGEAIRDRGLDYERIDNMPVLAPRYSRSEDDVSPIGYLFRAVPQGIRFLRKRGISVVHTNDGRMHATWSLPSRLAGCRLVWHHRAAPDAAGVNRLAPILANQIVSVSEFSRPVRPILPIDTRFKVVRSPMVFPSTMPSRPECHARLCAELNTPDTSLILGYVGYLNERKRPVHFVEAVAKIIDARPDHPIHGLIFGQDEVETLKLEDACMKRAAELGISSKIHLMGFRKPIEPAIAGLDLLLVSAINEPFGRTLIEAMTLGTPVVATRHGGNIEAIEDGETGFLVDHKDPASFVSPVLKLHEDPQLYEHISRSAREKTLTGFSCETAAKAVSEIYAGLTQV